MAKEKHPKYSSGTVYTRIISLSRFHLQQQRTQISAKAENLSPAKGGRLCQQTAWATVLSKQRPANRSWVGGREDKKDIWKLKAVFINTGGLVHIYNPSKCWWPWTMAVCQQTHPSLGSELLEVMAQEPLRSSHPPSRTIALGQRWHPGKERGVF